MSPQIPSFPVVVTKLPRRGLQVVRPNSTDVWRPGEQHDIVWRQWGGLTSKVHIALFSVTGQPKLPIAIGAPNSGSFRWRIPNIRGGKYMVAVATTDLAVYDFSDVFRIASPVNVVAVGAGERASFAVMKSNGSVRAWGINGSIGLLGDGALMAASPLPVQVSGLSAVIEVVASGNYALALDANGIVWAWGANTYGNLGDGSTTNRPTPVQVQNLAGVTKISAGREALALKNDGTVWAWGYTPVPVGGSYARTTPVQVQGLAGVTDTAAGGEHSLALDGNGNVWAWGSNQYGQLGDGTTNASFQAPVQVQNFAGIAAVAAGVWHSVALKSDGTVWAWGSNLAGELGNGTGFFEGATPAPGQVIGLSGMTEVAAGGYQSFAIRNDGTLWAWGWNYFGQFGNGTTGWALIPVQVQSSIKAVAPGYAHSLFLKQDETVWAAGWNQNGQLGDGTNTDRTVPVQTRL